MSLLHIIENLRDEITSPKISSRVSAMKKLSETVDRLPYPYHPESVRHLIAFHMKVLTEHHDLLPSVLNGLKALMDYPAFDDQTATELALTLTSLDVPQLNESVRLQIYKTFKQLFTYHLNDLKTLGTNFLRNFINMIDGENSPECVYLVMELNKIIVENLCIDEVVEEYFESISNYFPVEFKSSKVTKSDLTREKLMMIHKDCMIASPKFGPQLLPLLLEKITSEKKSARADALDVFTACLTTMNFDDIDNYYKSFMDALIYEAKQRDDECYQLALKSFETLASVFQEKASEKELLEFCWQLFELTSGIIADNNKRLHEFLHAAVDGKPRIWCGTMAYMLPPLMEKSVKLEMEDTENLEVILSLLSACGELSKYPGIVSCSNSKLFFSRLDKMFTEMIESSTSIGNPQTFVIVFRLLAYYSLFNVWIGDTDTDDNIKVDTEVIIESRHNLLKKSIDSLAMNFNSTLEECLLLLIPQLLESSILLSSQINNKLTLLIFSYANSPDILRNFAFRIFTVIPTSCLDNVLSTISTHLNESIRDTRPVTSCLAKLVKKFSKEKPITDKLYVLILELVENLCNQSSLDCETVSNIAIALRDLGDPSDNSLKSDVIQLLLRETRSNDLSHPSVIWFCSILQRSPMKIITNSLSAHDLLNLLFFMFHVADKEELRSILCQTYASLMNQISFNTVEKDFHNHLKNCGEEIGFILWNLKAAMFSGQNSFYNELIKIIVDPDFLSSKLGPLLLDNLQILFRSESFTAPSHFCQDRLLFSKLNNLYEQLCYCVVAQPFKLLAKTSLDDTVQEMAMEIYLKLIESYPKYVIEMSIDEIVASIAHWFVRIKHSKISLRVSILRVICSLNSQDIRILKYADDIVENIVTIFNSLDSLMTRDRLFLAKLIGWFVRRFPDYDTIKHFQLLKSSLNKLISDKKRVVRLEAARTKMILLS